MRALQINHHVFCRLYPMARGNRASAALNGVGLLEVRQVARLRNHDQLGAARSRACISSADGRRRDRVFFADDDERRAVDRRQQRRRIGTRHQRASPRRQSPRSSSPASATARARPPRAARRASSRRAASGASRRRPPPAPARARAASIRAPSFERLRRVGLRARVGEHQSLEIARRVAEHRERDVAAHRQAADHRLVHVQRVEQIDDVAGVSRPSRRPADLVARRRSRGTAARRRASPAAASASCGSHMRALSGKACRRTSVPRGRDAP